MISWRETYTTPEIRRTNLAAVILQSEALRLGSLDAFPFLDPPRPDAVRDGYRTLFELGAIDTQQELTELGHQLARLPVDPRIARMILAADQEGCMHEVLIIASALELQDPRERPVERQQQADASHEQFRDDKSDFLSYLKLWDFYQQLRADLSRSKLKKACQQNFLSFHRMREWCDIHRQLMKIVSDSQLSLQSRRHDYAAIHRALLTGLLAGCAQLTDRNEYTGAGQQKLFLWPGSGLFAGKPRWIVAAELIETSRRYARIVAEIDPGWIESLADHLVKRSYSDHYWSRKRGAALTRERVTLFGLPVVVGRQVALAPIDPETARSLLIEAGLAEFNTSRRYRFLEHNRQVLDDLQQWAAKSRQSRLVVGTYELCQFYESRLPAEIVDEASLRQWLKQPQHATQLEMTIDALLGDSEDDANTPATFPDRLQLDQLDLPLTYSFEPGDERDGVTLTIPHAFVRQLNPGQTEWLVRGHLQEKIQALIRSLPKTIRRGLVPAPDVAREAAARLRFGEGNFLEELVRVFRELRGEEVPVEAFRLDKLPPHLRLLIEVVDEQGQAVQASRDLAELQESVAAPADLAGQLPEAGEWSRDDISSWDFGELPDQVRLTSGGLPVVAYPSLVDRGDHIGLCLATSEVAARAGRRAGIRRLFILAEHRELRAQIAWLPDGDRLRLAASLLPGGDFEPRAVELLADRAFLHEHPLPANEEAFQRLHKTGLDRLLVAVQEISSIIDPLLSTHQQVRIALEGTSAERWQAAVEDIRSQLDELVRPGFLVATPWSWLGHYPRYFRAILHRLDKLRHGGAGRDEQLRRDMAPRYQLWLDRRSALAARGEVDEQLEGYRWMLEEYRVSLFAQQLGTSLSVSPQRLDKQWARVVRG